MEAHEHQKKYNRIDALVNEPIMQAEITIHYDWLAIAMYYGSLHLVHKHCASRKTPAHPGGHDDTLNQARRVKRGPKVHGELLTLYNASLDARYEPVFLEKEDVVELRKSYKTIQSILA